jgi:hypothetical protein
MGTMKEAMTKAGLSLSEEESQKVKSSLTSMKRKFRRATCRKCGEDIQFVDVNGRMIPHNLDNNPHWQTCSYSSFAQKKASLNIMKKLSVLFIVKLGLDVESEAGLTKKEAQIVHAVLEKVFKESQLETAETPGEIIDNNSEEDLKADLQAVESEDAASDEVEPKGDDPIGDPDEDLAPSEEAIKEEESKEASE